jgi:hypothetical protein
VFDDVLRENEVYVEDLPTAVISRDNETEERFGVTKKSEALYFMYAELLDRRHYSSTKELKEWIIGKSNSPSSLRTSADF